MGDSAVDAAIESPITDYLPAFSPSHSMPRHLLVQLMQIDEDRHIARLEPIQSEETAIDLYTFFLSYRTPYPS
jgi:hypothetical protein